MQYCIDYRNGSMGKTILSHALFACSQVDINLDKFFSKTGNAHAIPSNLILTAHHLREFPNNSLECVLEIVCNDWDRILRFKMSYSKWMNKVPTYENYQLFFNELELPDINEEWDNVYEVIKGSTWPSNPGYANRNILPTYVLNEMKIVDLNFSTDRTFLEALTLIYFDMLNEKEVSIFCDRELSLQSYLDGEYNVLKELCEERLGWTWDARKDEEFFQKVKEVNSEYFIWLERIKNAVSSIEFDSFDLWEQALIAAKVCKDLKLDVRVNNMVLDKLFKNK